MEGVPETGEEHQQGNRRHGDAAHVGVEDHEEVAYEHPAEVTAHVAKTVGDLADEGDFDVGVLLGRVDGHAQPSFAIFTTALTMLALSDTLLSMAFWMSSKSKMLVTIPFKFTFPAATASIAMG